MTQYPRDEFDRIPESAARQGVHRERIAPPRTGGLVFKVIAGLLVLVVGLAAYFLFPRLGIGQASDVSSATTSTPTPSDSPEETAEAEPTETEEETAQDSGEEPGTQPSAEETAGATPSAEPGEEPSPEQTETAAAVDRSQPVAVLNATTVSGLASTAAGRLQADGWVVGQIGNWSGQQLQGSIVFYNGEEQRATAEELAAVLGIPTVQGDAGFASGITAVVGPGFQ